MPDDFHNPILPGFHPDPSICRVGQDYSFHMSVDGESWLPIARNLDGRLLSTQRAGGFVGAYVGMYASSQGHPSANHADFDWFEYVPDRVVCARLESR